MGFALPADAGCLRNVGHARRRLKCRIYLLFSRSIRTPMLTIGFVLPAGFQTMGLAAVSAFELANVKAKDALYAVRLLSEQGGAIPNSVGICIETRSFARQSL